MSISAITSLMSVNKSAQLIVYHVEQSLKMENALMSWKSFFIFTLNCFKR